MNIRFIKDLLVKSCTLLTVSASAATLHGYFSTAKDKVTSKALAIEKARNEALQKSLQEHEAANYLDKPTNAEVQSLGNVLKEQYNGLQSIKDKLNDLLSKNPATPFEEETLASDTKYHWLSEYVKKTEDVNNTAQKILDKLGKNDDKDNFINNLPDINQIIESWNHFLQSLTFEQLGALAHFLSSLVVFICLLNLLSVIYGEYIIRILKLESRFIWLAKIIQLRRKFQLYYMLVFFTVCFINLIGIMYIDILVFFSDL